MIGSIAGVLCHLDDTAVLIETPSGVGYEMDVPLGLLSAADMGGHVRLYTHLVVREDAQMLFGFLDLDMRSVFRDLIKLSGVGPKVALLVLSSLSIADLRAAVYRQDTASMMQIKGIGKRVAEKMLIELKSKVDKWPVGALPSAPDSPARAMHADALEALLALGYPKKQAEQALHAVEASELTEWVRLALRQLAMPHKEGGL